ncbi:MAG: hypothetical protein K2G63_04835 [Oscillospiraceae bacterium]|nr:hypothetical protein [Oscillospiraceae bacterium]
MKLYQIREYSKVSLKGRKAEAFLISLCIPAIIVFFRLAELCTASIVLYLTDFKPMELFYKSPVAWILFDFICIFLKVLTLSAVISPIIRFFLSILNIQIPDFKNSGIFIKNLNSIIIIKTVSLIFLMPSVFFGITSVNIIFRGYENGNPNTVFLAVHSVTLTVLSLILWIWIVLGISALPFLIIKEKDIGIFRLSIISFRIMKNARRGLLKIILFYTGVMLIPFGFISALPEFFSSLTLYINICIKESECNEIYSMHRKSHNCPKIPDRKGNLKTSAEET